MGKNTINLSESEIRGFVAECVKSVLQEMGEPQEISKNFRIAPEAYKQGYTCEYFEKDADEIQRHHFNDDFHLYVTTYAEDHRILGISVLSDEETIDWFVKRWVEKGILIPA